MVTLTVKQPDIYELRRPIHELRWHCYIKTQRKILKQKKWKGIEEPEPELVKIEAVMSSSCISKWKWLQEYCDRTLCNEKEIK